VLEKESRIILEHKICLQQEAEVSGLILKGK
jgi:hypothetical protein